MDALKAVKGETPLKNLLYITQQEHLHMGCTLIKLGTIHTAYFEKWTTEVDIRVQNNPSVHFEIFVFVSHL